MKHTSEPYFYYQAQAKFDRGHFAMSIYDYKFPASVKGTHIALWQCDSNRAHGPERGSRQRIDLCCAPVDVGATSLRTIWVIREFLGTSQLIR